MTPGEGSLSKESIARIDELLPRVQALPDAAARTLTAELVQAVMSLHAAALQRMVEIAATFAPDSLKAMGSDPLVSPVLALHGLHPDDFAARIARAIAKLRQYFDSRGAGIELLEAGPDLVRVHFSGSRPGSGQAARPVIEDAIYEAAPEVGSLIIEGAEDHEPGFVPLASLLAGQRA
jgi:hypothetical protein